MLERFFSSLRPVRYYALFVLLCLGWFAWGSFSGTWLLGDDKESTEALDGPAGSSHGGSGHARFYHK